MCSFVRDSTDKVISLPPVTNSESSKVLHIVMLLLIVRHGLPFMRVLNYLSFFHIRDHSLFMGEGMGN